VVTTVLLLADKPDCIPAVASIRWREWGHDPEPEDPELWMETTTREAGSEHLPVTFVALADNGSVIGAVGLAEFDLSSQLDKTPWVIGMVVAPECRSQRVGRSLIRHLQDWAVEHGFADAWVATGEAAAFYCACGWSDMGSDTDDVGRSVTVLHMRWPRPG
jgi:predicted N-acetyltransferase YhbS